MTPLTAFIFVLIIIFLLICLECVLRKHVSYVFSDITEKQEVIESKIRELIFLNPKSEIIILCTQKNPDTISILTKLKKDYPQLHIIE